MQNRLRQKGRKQRASHMHGSVAHMSANQQRYPRPVNQRLLSLHEPFPSCRTSRNRLVRTFVQWLDRTTPPTDTPSISKHYRYVAIRSISAPCLQAHFLKRNNRVIFIYHTCRLPSVEEACETLDITPVQAAGLKTGKETP